MSDARAAVFRAIRPGGGDPRSPRAIAQELEDLGPPPPPPLDARDPVVAFGERLAASNGSLEVAADRASAVHCISRYLYREHNTRRVVAGYDRRLAAMPWRDGGVLVRFGCASAEDPVSISYATLGVGETAALLLCSSRDNPASNNWLVQDHIILLDEPDLMASYEGAWARLREILAGGADPRGLHFITGPSGTADIQGQHVTGAHGPQRLHVIYIGHGPDEAG